MPRKRHDSDEAEGMLPKLPDETNSSADEEADDRQTRISKRILLAMLIIVILSISASCSYAIAQFAKGSQTPLVLSKSSVADCYCGGSVLEAEALDCTYDELAAAWLPQYCIDTELSEEFSRSGPGKNGTWAYYNSPAATQLLTVEQVAHSGGTGFYVWVTREWHLVHCIFYWKKLFRATETNVIIEARYSGWRHINHCAKVLQDRTPSRDDVNTHFGVVLSSASPGAGPMHSSRDVV